MSGASKSGAARLGSALAGIARAGIAGVGGLLPVAGYVQWLKGNDGETLTDKVAVLSEPSIVDVPCVAFNGVDGFIDTGVALNYGSADYEITVRFRTANGATFAGNMLLGARDANDDGIRIFFISGDIYCSHSQGGGTDVDLSFTGTSYWDGNWHTLVMSRASDTLTVTMDGVSVGTPQSVAGVSIDVTTTAKFARYAYSSTSYMDVDISYAKASGYFEYNFEETSGTTHYDVSGNGNDGTASGGVTHITADGIPSHNDRYGFRLDTGVYIPALLNGSAAADGGAITNPPGMVHNTSTTTRQQTAAFNAFGAAASFYGNGVDTWDKKTFAQLDTQYASNGTNNLWLKKVDGFYTDAVQYPLAQVFSAADTLHNQAYFGA